MTASFQIDTKRAWIAEVSTKLCEDAKTGELLRVAKVRLEIGLTSEIMDGAAVELKTDDRGEWKHRMKRPDLGGVTVKIGDLFITDAKPVGKSIGIGGGVMVFVFKAKLGIVETQELIGMMDGEQAVSIASMQEALPGLDGADALLKAAAEFDAMGVEVEVRYAE